LVVVLVLIALESRALLSRPGSSRPPSADSQDVTDPTPPRLNASTPPGLAPEGMAWVPGGEFWMGGPEGPDHDSPRHKVYVDSFWMDRTEVTNAQFAKFVAATGYVTVAERPPDPKQYPGAKPENLVPGSAVFVLPEGDVPLDGPPVWWQYVRGANWRHPD